jgi:hypothetical protein
MSTKRWVNPDEIVAYHYRRPSSDAVGFADWLVVLRPLPDV